MNYVVTSTLPSTFGGRTKSLLRRTKLLMEKGLDFTLISTNYHSDYSSIYDLYKKKGYVPNHTKFINIYDFLREENTNEVPEIIHNIEEKEFIYEKVNKRNAFRYFDNGVYTLYKDFTYPNEKLRFIDVMSPFSEKKIIRKEFDLDGHLQREIYYVFNSLNKIQEILYKKDGKPYINRLFANNKNNSLKSIFYFKHDDEILHFSKESDFFQYCFEKIIEPNSNVICDARLLDKGLLKAKIKNCKKIFVQHSTFHTLKGIEDVKKSYRYLRDHADQASKIVLLTENSKKNWEKVSGYTQNAVSIPHSMDLKKIHVEDTKRDSNKIVMITRLDENKQVDHAIKAFKILSEYDDRAYFEIYGEGEKESHLKILINELGLADKVFLKGRTENPDKVFRSAHFSLFTSKFEGMGLVVLESLLNGCPVISYDIHYGPNEMINHNKSGLLVEPNNIPGLAEAMKTFVDRDNFEIEIPPKFSNDNFIEKWLEILN